jgi:hypothetical protein
MTEPMNQLEALKGDVPIFDGRAIGIDPSGPQSAINRTAPFYRVVGAELSQEVANV